MAKSFYPRRPYWIVYLNNILVHTWGSKNAHRVAVTAVSGTLQGDRLEIVPKKYV
jgi:hypothetical protein